MKKIILAIVLFIGVCSYFDKINFDAKSVDKVVSNVIVRMKDIGEKFNDSKMLYKAKIYLDNAEKSGDYIFKNISFDGLENILDKVIE